MNDAAAELAALIRADLADPAPEGLRFHDHVLKQDAALDRLAHALGQNEPATVAEALAAAIAGERDGWRLLKLLELSERLELAGTAEALMRVAAEPPGDDDRSRFLAARASEVLLKLPLDRQTRLRADAVSKQRLEDADRYRLGAARARQLHRPRRVEWALLVALMLLGVGGFIFSWMALGQP